ncbi:transcriptional regulator, DeoR family [Beutenbergia cavernae DSM 12333]|uniref:Transcriptional regulator, DeoR family n=1 Tax=Beutenbergia cavernae (strain ATCC BAA-8 / DSM 12333 / CCUG 43141 / JCM 11478 / NBRC 16432 / NCIMB 13614 / HKI 0122) TaxID=471853 RepID=C5C368_BEUC1|nr:DeoR/GlpR family DNA-binding transcription regulator [Beutenbergia cavernae]ACQ79767.1 transcriptional regulator, DeoR family [Beutenbergia cavernae DSM 12333]
MSSSHAGRRPSARDRARQERQELIASYVLAKGVATPHELTEVSGASIMTVHRDLDELARRGLIRKFHGGVSAKASSVFESSSAFRLHYQSEHKDALAEAVLERIEPGMSVMLDTSSTNVFLARRIARLDDVPLTVITNYQPILHTLRSCDGVSLIMIGGRYSTVHDAFFGIDAVAMTQGLRANLAVLSTSAMTPDETYHQDQDIVLMKRAMMAAADERVLLMDPTKIRRTALHRLAPTRDFDELLLTDPDDPEFVAAVSEHVPTRIVKAARASEDQALEA